MRRAPSLISWDKKSEFARRSFIRDVVNAQACVEVSKEYQVLVMIKDTLILGLVLVVWTESSGPLVKVAHAQPLRWDGLRK